MASQSSKQVPLKREQSLDDELAKGMSSAQVSIAKSDSPSDDTDHLKSALKDTQSYDDMSMTPQTERQLQASGIKDELGEANGHVSTTKGVGRPKGSRSASQKAPARLAPLFDHLPDATNEANAQYSVMDACTYQNKYLGYTEHAMECDCVEEWDSVTQRNHACGDDSDCINRATKMECVGDCACGTACQNQRFGQRQYADVSVIKTEKKGYGLRTNVGLKHGEFIFEYIGEVIAEAGFRRRMVQYDDEGIKHFYFMSLSKGEFVDATRKGNLGRFCNHSCNPNCYVDKWVVGDKLRMGIFAERKIRAGEELVFNYNVDRYGANPQPCYCGESNCTGFIGGKTQTERATKLSTATIEALGIEDDFDNWDTAVSKRPKKKKTGEDDEDYVDSIEAKKLDADGVTKVMAALMQCKEKWIAVRLLQRLQRSDDEDVRHRIVKLHGYQIMNSQLSAWRDDENVVLQILDILDRFPRLTRNKIVDAKIDKTLEPLAEHGDERVAIKARLLLEVWSQLELAYRIPRKVRDRTGPKSEGIKFERRESAQHRRRSPSRSRSRSKTPPKGPVVNVPSGPRLPQRAPPPPFRRGPLSLPTGWSQTTDEATGRTYFYTSTGRTQWVRPTQPAEQPPPPTLPKQPSQQDLLKSIIDDIVAAKDKDKEVKAPMTESSTVSKKEKRPEKWRSYDEEKQKKLYENTLFPHISHVMSKYKHKIPKDDLKRFGKEIAKKLVSSDYKAGRVKDPTKIDEKQQKKIKAFCKEYFDKAVQKHQKHEAARAVRKAKKEPNIASTDASANGTPSQSSTVGNLTTPSKTEVDEEDDDEEMKMSENEIEPDNDETPETPLQANFSAEGTLKRKRFGLRDGEDARDDEDEDLLQSPAKKVNLDSAATSPVPPPPPPAPPIGTPPENDSPAHLEEEGTCVPEEMDTDLHADTNFRGQSMADVLAQAQADDDEHKDNAEIDDAMAIRVSSIKSELADMTYVKKEPFMAQTNFESGLENTFGENNIGKPGSHAVKLENPMTDGQQIIAMAKEQLEYQQQDHGKIRNNDQQHKDEDEIEWS